MARSFTEQEKQNIQTKLLSECEKSWAKYGYKKTSIDELCAKAAISKGAFYLFYESKEALFCEVFGLVLDSLYSNANEIMEKQPNKYGLAKALKALYREYDKNSFIYDTKSADFVVFTNKLNKEQLDKLSEYGEISGKLFLDKPYLKLLVSYEQAISTLFALLSTISVKDRLPYNHLEVFDFMMDNLIDKIFE